MPLFVAAAFTGAQTNQPTWLQSQRSWRDERRSPVWCAQAARYQPQKGTRHNTMTRGHHTEQSRRITKQTPCDPTRGGAWSRQSRRQEVAGVEGGGESCLMDMRFQFDQTKSLLETGGGDGHKLRRHLVQ